jgi:uncharacterized protein (UPF0276 family)
MIDKLNKLKNYGVGLGLRRDLFAETYSEIQSSSFIQCLEIVPENYISKGGKPRIEFEKFINSNTQLIPHGVNLSIGTAYNKQTNYDNYFLEQLEELFLEIKAPWFSDHLSCTRINGFYLQDLIPIPFTNESLNIVADNIKYLQDRFQLNFLFENPSYYSTLGLQELSETDFMNKLAEKADCGILLDVNNIYVNSINHGSYNPSEYLNSLDLSRVVQVHIAGHHENYTAWLTNKKLRLLDTHGAEIKQEVYEILDELASRIELKAIILERDSNIPSLDELKLELDHINQIIKKQSLRATASSSSLRATASRRRSRSEAIQANSSTEINNSLVQLQEEILNYLRNKKPDTRILPTEIQEELSIYKSLILSSLEGLLKKVLPLSYKILENNWRSIIKLYYEVCPSCSAIYNQAVERFPEFLNSEEFKKQFPDYPNYLSELTIYEWTNLKTYNSKEKYPIEILQLNFPVSKIILYLQSTEDEIEEVRLTNIEEENEFLLSFRDYNDLKSKFIQLDGYSIYVLRALESSQDLEKIYIDFKNNFSQDLKEQDENFIRNAYNSLIETFRNYKILLE